MTGPKPPTFPKILLPLSSVSWSRTGSRDSSVSIGTRYGLDGPGIKSRWGVKFSAPVQTGPGVHPASSTMGTGSFLGIKRPGRGVDHPPPSSAEVFVVCYRENFTFTFILE